MLLLSNKLFSVENKPSNPYKCGTPLIGILFPYYHQRLAKLSKKKRPDIKKAHSEVPA